MEAESRKVALTSDLFEKHFTVADITTFEFDNNDTRLNYMLTWSTVNLLGPTFPIHLHGPTYSRCESPLPLNDVNWRVTCINCRLLSMDKYRMQNMLQPSVDNAQLMDNFAVWLVVQAL